MLYIVIRKRVRSRASEAHGKQRDELLPSHAFICRPQTKCDVKILMALAVLTGHRQSMKIWPNCLGETESLD
jgi:hypothetical protein